MCLSALVAVLALGCSSDKDKGINSNKEKPKEPKAGAKPLKLDCWPSACVNEGILFAQFESRVARLSGRKSVTRSNTALKTRQ